MIRTPTPEMIEDIKEIEREINFQDILRRVEEQARKMREQLTEEAV